MNTNSFDRLDLIEPIQRALRLEGYKIPTPIQQYAIPHLLTGRDMLGSAQTGTGKTAAFALPILQRLADGVRKPSRAPRALILTPTRELAIQVARSFASYGRFLQLKETVIFGGVFQGSQARALAAGVDILVATPGRLLDLMNQRLVQLNRMEIFVLDEVDRMLDMGFIHDVKKIVAALPSHRQSIFFSATVPHTVKQLAFGMLSDPATISVNSNSPMADRIDQKVMFVDRGDKESLLLELLKNESIYRALIFTRTKHRADKVADKLKRHKIPAEALHGNKSQGARQKALSNFTRGNIRVLVATDIAARGIDVNEITHVINFELPKDPESYVHRIGRTARAGAEGFAISFCDGEERPLLLRIERVIKSAVPVDENHQFHSVGAAASTPFSGSPDQPGRAPKRSNRSESTFGRRSNPFPKMSNRRQFPKRRKARMA